MNAPTIDPAAIALPPTQPIDITELALASLTGDGTARGSLSGGTH